MSLSIFSLHAMLFANGATIAVIVLMLFMAFKLYESYKNKQIYQLLISALLLFFVKHSLLLSDSLIPTAYSSWLNVTAILLQIISFIIINFVYLKLYTYRSAQLKVVPFALLAAFSLLLPVAEHFMPQWPMLDLYSLAVVLIVIIATRSANLTRKYYASLIIYFIYELARLANQYLFETYTPYLKLIIYAAPILYYCLLFLLLFDWVIDRLLTTYHVSILDGLTGLYNRRHFQSKAEQMIRQSTPVAIIFCDIDNFKKLNDTKGHLHADVILKQVAEIIKEETAEIGISGRYGGEELLACIAVAANKVRRVAESIRSRVELESGVTVSVGYSIAKQPCPIHELVKQADEAMYMSKTSGKNKVSAYKTIPAALKKNQAVT
ncbi:GGDEF domain-containing protein [Paenibacillus sp. IITD108]|uniref:GGDEF domain-containing protein n=1 Tax=Paenibacillus sp. IITD108 TaxID=3116649 RepID=UPI002F427012